MLDLYPLGAQLEFELSDVLEGNLLSDALENQSLDGVLERAGCVGRPGVYVWLRRLSPKNHSIGTPSAFLEWIQGSVGRTQGEVKDRVRHIGHISFKLGGSTLSEKNVASLAEIGEDYAQAKQLQRLLRQFDYTQALYVGESADLGSRIREHVSGQSGFSDRLAAFGYGWEEVGLRFAALPETMSISQRKAIERALAIWLIAPQTDRAG